MGDGVLMGCMACREGLGVWLSVVCVYTRVCVCVAAGDAPNHITPDGSIRAVQNTPIVLSARGNEERIEVHWISLHLVFSACENITCFI